MSMIIRNHVRYASGGNGGDPSIEITQAEYDELVSTNSIQKDVTYYITDSKDEIELDAAIVKYDNTESGLEATDVQSAISELSSNLDILDSNLNGISFVLNDDGTIAGYTSGGADTVHPFKGNNVKLFHDDNFTWSTWKNGGTYFPTETRSGTNFRFDTYDGICSAYIQSTRKDFTKFKELKLYIVSTRLSNGSTGDTKYYSNSFTIKNSSGTTVKSISIPYSTSNKLYTIDLSGLEGTHYMRWDICHCQTIFSYLELN